KVLKVEKALKEALASSKFKCGRKQVLQSIKGSKLIVISRSTDAQTRREIETQAPDAGVPIYQFDGNSTQLGKLCGKPFRVAVVALKAE
ncbi:MAG TPA: ribosomal L7Ae/L30e/S12e/Gadd45 family protein, partial [Candidatus Nitrosopolaris sp.]|nr:ribosomal L7Ae/L30e/S12e/Gadd45 family protein [Candidatus Nitrosopolaris sp.]